MARKTVKVEVPRDERPPLIKLALGIVKQHEKLAANSPITDKVVDMAEYKQRADAAAALQVEIEELEADLQQKVGQCDVLLGLSEGQNAQSKGTTLFETLQLRDYLLAVHRGNEESLETYGYAVVVGSASAPKKKQKPA